MIRHALARAMLGAAFLALNACGASSGPAPITPSGGAGSGSPAAQASPTGMSSPSAAAAPVAASPSPVATPPVAPSTGALTQADINRPLEPGTYRIADTFSAPFAITVPVYWRLKSLSASDVEFAYTVDGVDHPAWVVVALVDNVFKDPCHSAGGPAEPAVPRSVDAITRALTHMAGYKAGPVTDVTTNGRTGEAVDLVSTIDTETAACDAGKMLPLWTNLGGGGGSAPGLASEKIRVVDVDGTPVIVDGETFENTPSALRDAIKPIVETIAFN